MSFLNHNVLGKLNFKQKIAIVFFVFICSFFIPFRFFDSILKIAIGGGFISGAYYMRKVTRNMIKNGIKSKAKIVDFYIETEIKRHYRGGSRTRKIDYYFPIVSFADTKGITITQKVDTSVNHLNVKIDDFVNIIYLKNSNDYQVMLDSNLRKFYFSIILFVIGGYFFLIGVLKILGAIVFSL